MKPGIHPEYVDATISCACGNVIQTRGTVARMHVDICSKCHPFYTGKRQQLVDRGGRIEQFHRRYSRRQRQEGEAAAAGDIAQG
ncbi:MAG: 50S ribosomal protein L31 [Candidatus Latescibacterota bacterium]